MTESGVDLVQDAVLPAMSAIDNRIDHSRNGQPYFWTDLTSDPPRLQHQSWDYCDMSSRWVEALIDGRAMTGLGTSAATEALLREFLLSRADPVDGLFYNADAAEFGSIYAADLFCQSRVLSGLLALWKDTGEQRFERQLDRMVDGLGSLAVWDGPAARFPGTLARHGRWLDVPDATGQLDPKVAPVISAPGYRTCLLGGLASYGQLAGDRRALELAQGLATYYLTESGAVRADGSYQGHTHSGGVLPTAVGVLRLGLAIDDDQLISWAQRVYDFTASQATSFGWLPDGVGFPDSYVWSGFCETCALADFIELGVLLSGAGAGDYWDLVERCGRNQLMENQFRTTEGLIPAHADEQVHASTIGGFACAATPNSALGWTEGLEGCCLGAGLRAWHLLWSNATVHQGQRVVVNFPLTKRTEAVETISAEPVSGTLTVRLTQPATLDLRIPGSRDSRPTSVELNGKPLGEFAPSNRHTFPDLAAGSEVVARYDLPHAEESVEVAGRTYSVTWKGNTVVGMDPPSDVCPTYERKGWQ